MSFPSSIADYIQTQFLSAICLNNTYFRDIAYQKWCFSAKDTVPGLPELSLEVIGDKTFAFKNSEYFIFPIHNMNTLPMRASYGLEYFSYATHLNINPSDNFYFGQLLVAKYQTQF